MKIFMIGGTGLLGYAGAKELIKRGHSIVTVALPPVPKNLDIPHKMELVLDNYLTMSDQELKKLFKGCEGFVFAAGIDERVEGKPPIYELYKKYNIDALKRLMDLANEMKVKHVVILGSYFSYFDKVWPELKLSERHPYIKSRIEQEKMVFKYVDKNKMSVAVLELPYIFGAQQGRKPVWQFIAEMIKSTKGKYLFYPKGGTAMVTIKQVGEAIAGAIEHNIGANSYPVGWYNMTWKEWLEKFSLGMNNPKKIITVPTFLYKLVAGKIMKKHQKKGIESGLDLVEFSKMMTAKTYIDNNIIKKKLGVKEDNINRAIEESAKLCLGILDNPKEKIIDMKTE